MTTERPILFSAPMIKAILAGEKTMTRRIVKPQPDSEINPVEVGDYWQWATAESRRRCPYGAPGSRLWCRESFTYSAYGSGTLGRSIGVRYKADGIEIRYPDTGQVKLGYPHTKKPLVDIIQEGKVRPSIHMPRWASRITLEICSVRVERLRNISEADAKAEGLEPVCHGWKDYRGGTNDVRWWESPVNSYRTLWESIHGSDSWQANPWVWVVEFRRVTP